MNEPNNEARDRLMMVVRNHVSQLSEHFDNVQILASNCEQGGDTTSTFQYGCGNWQARLGHAREWMIYHEELNRQKARDDANEP